MKQENLNRAIEITESIRKLNDIKHIMSYPYPKIYGAKKAGFRYDNTDVSFVSLDNETNNQLKDAIRNVLDNRFKELTNELESL